ncbi:MAG: 50S ribosomal protein L11 methyltransferase [Cyanobacteria bacterium P01_F01_bin.42]
MTAEQWWEIEVSGTLDVDDLVFWELQQLGCLGTASFQREGRPVVCGYLSASQVLEADIEAIATQIHQAIADAGLPAAPIQWSIVLQEDWANSWKEYWHTEAIGEKFLIHPDWLPDPDPGDDRRSVGDHRHVIRLDPGVAFGTGAHATTQLCLEALERHVVETETAPTVADVGCGTGILSIAAIKLGAARAYGVDVDPLAVGSAQASRALNQIDADKFRVFEGSVGALIQHGLAPVDGICCNILAEVILTLIPDLTQLAQTGTWAILSGILERQASDMIDALKGQGWTVEKTAVKGEWCSIEATR